MDWIAVEESVPERFTKVLIWVVSAHSPTGTFQLGYRREELPGHTTDWQLTYRQLKRDERVTHWAFVDSPESELGQSGELRPNSQGV